ncbi:hypothetical protein HPB50_018192 [Hyalomma asiaticum]|uniref:Uncharacterized protein n=1 Tax=Hyalomma asiaticum TaxID=266040 RepID=A0ACB7TMQ0_HYAAI|nr:hypothetical protein HPB50_018192 [Hyalomma asiaticum]
MLTERACHVGNAILVLALWFSVSPDVRHSPETMDVSTDTATRAPNADAVREASKVASAPELGDEGGVVDGPRTSTPVAAKPSGEATHTKSHVELWFETLPAVEELPRSEGEGATPIVADGKTDHDKEPPPPAVADVASQTDDELFKRVKYEAAKKPVDNPEPDAPRPTRAFTFSVGRLA